MVEQVIDRRDIVFQLTQIQIQRIHGLQSKAFYVVYRNFHMPEDQVD